MALPDSITTITVFGTFLTPDGEAAAGAVYFTPSLTAATEGALLPQAARKVVLDDTGYFEIDLAATDDADWAVTGWAYTVTERIDGAASRTYSIEVPAATPGGTLDLATVEHGFVAGLFSPYVRATGDTMTGDLVLSGGADLTVSGTLTAEYDGTGIPASDVMRLIASTISTGVTSGGDLSPNAGDPTKLDITAATGWIVDYNSNGVISATNPRLTYVSLAAQTALTPTVGVPTGVTWWLVTSAGSLIQQTTAPTSTQRRTHLVLGATAQVGGTIVTAQSLPTIQSQPANQLGDLMDALGNFRISGAVISPNGANLNINLSSGRMFTRSFSQIPDYLDPHHADIVAETPLQFRHITGVAGMAGSLTSTLDVANYDPNGAGTVTAVPGGSNTAQNFRVWAFGTETAGTQVLIQYGQATYATLTLAQAAIGATQFVVNPTAAATGVLLGWISVIRTATNLSDTAQAIFVPTAGKFSTP